LKESEIKILLEIKTEIEGLVLKKKNEFDQLQTDIDRLTLHIEKLNLLISKGSFTTAAMLIDAETASKKPVSSNQMNLMKKIFSPSQKLLSTMQFADGNIIIRFPSPNIFKITQEIYITQIVKPILVPLKNSEPKMQSEVIKNKEGVETLINSITLKNIQHFDSFTLLYENLKKYFAKFNL